MYVFFQHNKLNLPVWQNVHNKKNTLFPTAQHALHLLADAFWPKALMRYLLAQTACAFFPGTYVAVPGRITAFEQPSAKADTQACFHILGFHHQNRRACTQTGQHVLICYIKHRFIYQAKGDAFRPQLFYHVQGPVQHFAVGNDIAIPAFQNEFILIR